MCVHSGVWERPPAQTNKPRAPTVHRSEPCPRVPAWATLGSDRIGFDPVICKIAVVPGPRPLEKGSSERHHVHLLEFSNKGRF